MLALLTPPLCQHKKLSLASATHENFGTLFLFASYHFFLIYL